MRAPGKFEFHMLQFLADHPWISVRALFEEFGEPKGLTRGTVVKTLDRLLKKGLIERKLVDDLYVYRAKESSESLQKHQVASFIRERLGGSLKPIAAFLAEGEGVDPEELKELKRLLKDVGD